MTINCNYNTGQNYSHSVYTIIMHFTIIDKSLHIYRGKKQFGCMELVALYIMLIEIIYLTLSIRCMLHYVIKFAN